MRKAFLILLGIVLFSALLHDLPYAKVTGPCANCHTMHNSQNGGNVARGGTGVGWNGSGQLTGGSLQGPQEQLLVASCVGCHSSTTGSTIITVGGSRIPIVFNTGGYPAQPLAGGNFYWTSQGGAANDAKGHNVYGIAGTDSRLSAAPGGGTCGAMSCHRTLAAAPDGTNFNTGGCRGCHYYTAHHDDTKPWYRFLKGQHMDITGGDYVTGREDPDWEQTTNNAKHNWYLGTTDTSYTTGLDTYHTITAFCSGCHSKFHGPQSGSNGMGSASPWIRHPTDIALPNSGEYSGYDPVNNYSVEAPVAWVDPANPARAGAVVMCLSCHRPHGSPYPAILRWDYNTNIAGGGGSGGCFTCHTGKK